MSLTPHLDWTENGQSQRAIWQSENQWPAPRRLLVADDAMTADQALRHASEGTGLLWRGDFQNARQLLLAMDRRISKRKLLSKPDTPFPERFHLVRQARSQRARSLGMLLMPVEPGHRISLRRAPDVRLACQEAYGDRDQAYVVPLTELLGVISAHEWRKKGVAVPGLRERIHAHYGVFAPVRGEYLRLLLDVPLPADTSLALDLGTGTGVLAALLIARGMERVIATDTSPRALACAEENLAKLGMSSQVTLIGSAEIPDEKASIIVVNPPWLPGKPTTLLEQAIYDPGSQMLKSVLSQAGTRLKPGGEVWLILSDLAEHLRLRPREELLAWIKQGGLTVIDRLDTRPVHPKSKDNADPLADARTAEITSLWRLGLGPDR